MEWNRDRVKEGKNEKSTKERERRRVRVTKRMEERRHYCIVVLALKSFSVYFPSALFLPFSFSPLISSFLASFFSSPHPIHPHFHINIFSRVKDEEVGRDGEK